MDRHFAPRRGATLVEYGLAITLIAIFVLGIIFSLGGLISGTFENAGNALEEGAGPGPGGGNPAEFTWTPPIPTAGEQTFFDGPDTATTWSWDFDEDSVVDSTIEDPIFVFPAADTYLVTLTTDEDSSSQAVEVLDGITDTFDRSVATGWGTASSGAAWTVDAGVGSVAADFHVDGDMGVMETDSTGPDLKIDLPLIIGAADPVTVTFTLLENYAASQYSDTYFFCYGDLFPGDAYGIEIYTESNGGGTTLSVFDETSGDFALDVAYARGSLYQVKTQITGQQILLKIWLDGELEPAGWDVQVGSPAGPRLSPFTSCFFYAQDGTANHVGEVLINDLNIIGD